jgi:hypothetical protein
MDTRPQSLEVLEQAGIPPVQARAMVQAIRIEIAAAMHPFVTPPALPPDPARDEQGSAGPQ